MADDTIDTKPRAPGRDDAARTVWSVYRGNRKATDNWSDRDASAALRNLRTVDEAFSGRRSKRPSRRKSSRRR